MNSSFIVLGLAMIIGAGFIYPEFRDHKRNRFGFIGLAIAGFGTILVGVFPENTIGTLHFLGALMPFLIGNLALVSFGLTLNVGRWLRYYTLLSGVVALIGLGLFLTNTTLGIGEGGVERLTAYPQTIWLIVFGLYMSRNHYLKQKLTVKVKSV